MLNEVYLSAPDGPTQGVCTLNEETFLFQREEGDTEVSLYRLSAEEWERVNTPPQSDADFADLKALHILMVARGPVLRGVLNAGGISFPT